MSSIICNVRGLLRDDYGAGYPRDYVVARLHGRRHSIAPATIAASGTATSDEHIWNAFLGELTWVFSQMNAAMRTDYAPLFALFEMKTIVLCLRNAELDRPEPRRQLLERSLLSDAIRDILRTPRHVGALVAALGGRLGVLSASFADLDARYFEAGLRGCEDALMRLFLESMRGARLVRPLRRFLTRFVDLRNLMALYKHLRWELKGPVAFIAGGSIDVASLKDIVIREDRDALDALVVTLTGRPVTAADEASLETLLLASLHAELSRASRRLGDEWLVTDYIWSAYLHARNLAVRHHAAGVDRARLERELIA
jgi:hypothetical protein